jgi:hypothetical protein
MMPLSWAALGGSGVNERLNSLDSIEARCIPGNAFRHPQFRELDTAQGTPPLLTYYRAFERKIMLPVSPVLWRRSWACSVIVETRLSNVS